MRGLPQVGGIWAINVQFLNMEGSGNPCRLGICTECKNKGAIYFEV